MSISSVVELTQPEPLSKRDQTPASPELDDQAFMKLLVAELKHQDPMEPLESREMITQLSQLSSVQTLKDVEKGIMGLHAEMAGVASTQVATLAGKHVTADANHMQLGLQGGSNGLFQLEGLADNVTVKILNEAGKEVRTLQLGQTFPGSHSFPWDGNTDTGERAPVGRYSVEIAATDAQGIRVASSSRVSGVVGSVAYENGYPELLVDGMRITLGDVTSIAQ